MSRMDGIPQGAMDGGAVMSRMDGIPQGAMDGGAVMSRMDGIPQGAMDGGAVMSRMDGQIFAPCNICTSTIRGGRIPTGAMDGSSRTMQEQLSRSGYRDANLQLLLI